MSSGFPQRSPGLQHPAARGRRREARRWYPAIVAHRGASHDAPENTMAAFELAWQQGADAIEADFQFTADGQIVAMHDRSAGRTGGLDRPVAEMTLAEIRALDVGQWKDGRFAGERAPTLEAVLKSLPAGKQLLIEIKCGTEILPELGRVLAAARARWSDLRIIGFDREVIAAARQALPGIKTYWLTDWRMDDAGVVRPTGDEILKALASSGADGLDCGGDPAQLDVALVERLKAAGYGVHAWTVDDAAVARTLAARGVESITTNRPAFIRAALEDGAGAGHGVQR